MFLEEEKKRIDGNIFDSEKTLFRMSTFDEVLYGRNDEKVPTSG